MASSARPLGAKWSKAGHHIVFGTREPASTKTREALLAAGMAAQAAFVREALAYGEVVLIAVPRNRRPRPGVSSIAASWTAKIVIDATNRFGEPVANQLATIRRGRAGRPPRTGVQFAGVGEF
ncbi:MAG: hypothetical protein KatS3mg060_0890 [Dehalococcoidia bacterium]|nr:MAG: hypothetical protein KatS3mg060_0890 [Dehalococcoidia bacterium]